MYILRYIVDKAIHYLNHKKSPGIDNILSDLFKEGNWDIN